MQKSTDQSTSLRFSTRWALILSVLGIAVGTGNIWRFPRIAAQNGGDDGAGAFIIAWIIFLLIWSIPLIIAEYAMGQKGRMGLVGTFGKIAGRKFGWMGGFVAFVATAIMFYYSVVAGWCVYYFSQMVLQDLPMTTDAAMGVWDGFQSGGFPVIFHALAMGVGVLVCFKGVRSIERANKILVPTLLVIVLIAVGRALTLEGSGAGLAYLFTPDWSDLTRPQLWLEALTQNAWDTGAGWGLILTYAAYMKQEHGIVKNAVLTGVGNNMVSLLAAIMIFGTVFAILGHQLQMPHTEVLAIMKDSGPASTGLTFIWMPQLFAQMAFGKPFAILFFLGLSFAAFSSLIAMIELATRNLVDGGLPRKTAIGMVAGLGFLLGIPSAINLDFFANQDFVWGVALMISGAFVAFAVIRYGIEQFRTEVILSEKTDWQLGRSWDTALKYLVPVQAIVLLVWWMIRAATEYAPDTWYDPTDPFSVMTCVVQWTIVMGAFYMGNKWLVRKTLGPA